MSKYKANVWTSLNLYDQNLKRGSCRVVVEQNFCKKKHPSVIRNTYIACIKGIYVTCKENRIYIPLYLTKFSRASRVIQERRCKVLTLLSQSLQRIIATIMLAVDIHYIVHNHHLPGIRFWTHVQRRRVCEAPKRAQRRSRSDPKHQRLVSCQLYFLKSIDLTGQNLDNHLAGQPNYWTTTHLAGQGNQRRRCKRSVRVDPFPGTYIVFRKFKHFVSFILGFENIFVALF